MFPPTQGSFTPPNKIWCPWKADCTQVLDQRGQVTVEMDQEASLPFELRASISELPTNTTYVVHFAIDHNELLIFKTVDGITSILHRSKDDDFLLHNGTGQRNAAVGTLASDFFQGNTG
jgi:hypothetical protein